MDWLLNILHDVPEPVVYLIIFGILLACGFGLPIPEDITLFAGGILSYYQKIDPATTVVVSLAGVMIGDCTMFYLGSHFGRRLTKKWIFHKLLPDERLAMVQEKLHEHGNKTMFFARFMPGLRSPVFFSAGTLHLPFRKFFMFDGLAALISVPTIILLVYFGGSQVENVIRYIQNVEHGIAVFIILIIAVLAFKWYRNKKQLAKIEKKAD